MIKIGLIGEDRNDTDAITQLMKQKYNTGYRYRTLSIYKRGSQLFTESAAKSFNFEIKKDPPLYVIVIADADATITETTKIRNKTALCKRLAKSLNCKSLLLLNIYELEALILADIAGLNNHYKTSINFKGSVSHQEKPKEYLQEKTGKKYKVADCPKLFQNLNFDTVRKNCSYFDEFINGFEKALL